jgi:hypothetical protein
MICLAVGTGSQNSKDCVCSKIRSAGITGSDMGVAFPEDTRGPQEASMV